MLADCFFQKQLDTITTDTLYKAFARSAIAHAEKENFNDDEHEKQETYGEMVDPCRDARGVFSRRSELVIGQSFRRQTRTTDGHR